jgi:hypothetical protein
MEGLLKYNYATADATGVAHDNIDAELAQNRQDKLEKIIHQSREEGSIRALPYLQTAEGKQTMLDIAMGSAFPGAAIGRVSKAAVTGGQRLLGSNREISNWLKLDNVAPSTNIEKTAIMRMIKRLQGKSGRTKGNPDWENVDEMVGKTKWDNKTNAARLAREKAYNKHELPHQRGNPAQPEERLDLMDSVSELLHAIRFRKN